VIAHRWERDGEVMRCARCAIASTWPGARASCSHPVTGDTDRHLARLTDQQRATLTRQARHRRERGASVPEIAARLRVPRAVVLRVLGEEQQPRPTRQRDVGERVRLAVDALIRGGAIAITTRAVAVAAGVTQHRAREWLARMVDAGELRIAARTGAAEDGHRRIVHRYEVSA
jgi:hypothetical protein